MRQVRPFWHEDLPAWGTMLGCHCFALEECDRHAEAEPHGRAAVALNPADLWSTHAVAHVLEMQGRQEEGIAWHRTGRPATTWFITCGGTAA